MKKAKIILACTIILPTFGGFIAFRANKFPPNVYSLLAGSKVISITISGVVCTTTVPNCTLTNKCTTDIGPAANVSSTTTSPSSTTVFKCMDGPEVVTTFAYCTLWRTRTTDCD